MTLTGYYEGELVWDIYTAFKYVNRIRPAKMESPCSVSILYPTLGNGKPLNRRYTLRFGTSDFDRFDLGNSQNGVSTELKYVAFSRCRDVEHVYIPP